MTNAATGRRTALECIVSQFKSVLVYSDKLPHLNKQMEKQNLEPPPQLLHTFLKNRFLFCVK